MVKIGKLDVLRLFFGLFGAGCFVLFWAKCEEKRWKCVIVSIFWHKSGGNVHWRGAKFEFSTRKTEPGKIVCDIAKKWSDRAKFWPVLASTKSALISTKSALVSTKSALVFAKSHYFFVRSRQDVGCSHLAELQAVVQIAIFAIFRSAVRLIFVQAILEGQKGRFLREIF